VNECRLCYRKIRLLKRVKGAEFCSEFHAMVFLSRIRAGMSGSLPVDVDLMPGKALQGAPQRISPVAVHPRHARQSPPAPVAKRRARSRFFNHFRIWVALKTPLLGRGILMERVMWS
jgi:hypothetical protein